MNFMDGQVPCAAGFTPLSSTGAVALPPASPASPVGITAVHATDAVKLTQDIRDWNFEFTQLKPGDFLADGGIAELAGISIARLTMNLTMMHRGSAPRGMFALFLPGHGSGPTFANGQSMETGQCASVSQGAFIEGVSHGRFLDIALGFDIAACRGRLECLGGRADGVAPGTLVTGPGPAWINDMLSGVDWLFDTVHRYPNCLEDVRLRASLADRILAALARFDDSPADVDSTTSDARAGRRAAVRIAREFIHARLREPLRLSELCRHANLKIRSLEYGFQEVTGLTPVAYIRSVRLDTVRRALQKSDPAAKRSISEIAMDAGFWHLSQFAADYRRFFGESPTETRRRYATN